MKTIKVLLKILFNCALIIFVVYSIILKIQGKNIKQEILSWFNSTVTLESVMEEKDMTREEAFSYLMETTNPKELPDVLEELKDHVFLNARGMGISSKLKDDVRVVIIFTGLLSAPWTTEEMEAAQADFQDMSNHIMAEAASYGTTLNLSLEFHTASVFKTSVPNDNSTDFVDAVLESAGLPSSQSASHDLEKEYNVDEVPIIFCLNYHDRSHAQSQYYGGHSEYAFLFRDTNGFSSYPHELYHIFGAKDFYYPADVKELAEYYFPHSTMLISEGTSVDELTAYLIGWTDEVSDVALSFLQDTAHLTPEYMSEQHDLETFTGFVTDYDDGDGIYTGYLDFGIPHGQGTKIWNDGRSYEGEWNNGNLHGEGTYTWANGNCYTGGFSNGRLEGYGTLTWADGTTYYGEWVGGNRTGSGTLIWYDGSTYEGEWLNDQRSGYGTLTWPNGDTFTGEWLNDQRTGYGTYTWADGSTMSGYWENNEFIE